MAAKAFKSVTHRATTKRLTRYSIEVTLIPADEDGEEGVFKSADVNIYFDDKAEADAAVLAYSDTMTKHEIKVAERKAEEAKAGK